MELGGRNPLVQIHDQGAGGNCNVVKEIIYPLGAQIDVRAVQVRGADGGVLRRNRCVCTDKAPCWLLGNCGC